MPTLAPGKLFGKIHSLNAAGYKIVIDRASLLTGDAATSAARTHGAIGPTEDVPNDYWIDDLGVQVTAGLAPGLVVKVVKNIPDTAPIDPDTFIADYTKYTKQFPYFWFTVAGGRIVQIEQVYFP